MASFPEPEPTTGFANASATPLPESTPFSTLIPLVEPRPKWEIAKAEWGAAWPVHWIGFSALFFLQALVVLTVFIRLKCSGRRNRPRSTASSLGKFTSTICISIFIFAFTRGIYLIVDPYESEQCLFGNQKYCPLWLSRVLFSLALPGLTVVFLLFHLAFLQVTKVRGLNSPGKLQSTAFLVLLSVFNYALAIGSDVVVAYINIKQILLPCQIYFIALGLILASAFMYSGSQIFFSSRQNWNEINKVKTETAKRLSAADINNVKTKYSVSPQLYKTLCLTGVSVLLWLVYVVLQVTSLVMLYVGALTSWWWLVFETIYRLCEFALATAVFAAATGHRSTRRTRANSEITTYYKSNCSADKGTAVIENQHANSLA